jgi:hypothetical protein
MTQLKPMLLSAPSEKEFMKMTANTTMEISDTLALLEATRVSLEDAFTEEYNPLCLFGAAAAEGVIEELLTNHPPHLFSDEEINLVMDVHELCGEILRQYEQLEDH